MRSAGSQALDKEERGQSQPREDGAEKSEGCGLKRLLHSREKSRPNGGSRDFRMEGGSNLDRSAAVDDMPNCLTANAARVYQNRSSGFVHTLLVG